MSLIYIQQRSYHYIILCVDGSVIRCLYLDVDGSGMAHADKKEIVFRRKSYKDNNSIIILLKTGPSCGNTFYKYFLGG